MSNEQRTYLTENGIKHQMSIPDSLQQNGQVERFQQTIVNGAEAMWHHTGLSNSFWIYAVKAVCSVTFLVTDWSVDVTL